MLRKLNTELLNVKLPPISVRSDELFCLSHLQLTNDQHIYVSLAVVLSHYRDIISRMVTDELVFQFETSASTIIKLFYLFLKKNDYLSISIRQFLNLLG